VKPDSQEFEKRLERFEQVLREAGIRITHQRVEIFREMARSGDHPDAETLHKRVRRRLPSVSLDTVYRTLWLLTDRGLITTLGPSRERTRFDANLARHHHFVCDGCGLTQDFYSQDLEELALPAVVKEMGQIDRTMVEARGLCRKCSPKIQTSRKT
jgi:Fur family peroxide stress response transcriptional regulator